MDGKEDGLNNRNSNTDTSKDFQIVELRAIEKELLVLRARSEAWESTVAEVLEWISGALRGDPLHLQLIELLLEELDGNGGIERVLTEEKFCKFCGSHLFKMHDKLPYSSSRSAFSGREASVYVTGSNADFEQKYSHVYTTPFTSSSLPEGKPNWSGRADSPEFKNPFYNQCRCSSSPPQGRSEDSYGQTYAQNRRHGSYWNSAERQSSCVYSSNRGSQSGSCYMNFPGYHNVRGAPTDNSTAYEACSTSETWRNYPNESRFHVFDSGSDEQRPIDYLYIRASGRIIPVDPSDRWPFC
ncbi:T. brucei spp.-specific protein [Trypanosoma brucei gambiense DAL972]|uniref:T. brucei spp.-specific protein n=1 Tax=Trypanosoma brucei gambiense (strain MHOM/CI/86/DAL972) TaxID=679716 RepID=C9ZQW6_TRYB9|nr:T. brucei spp.-specific protein [Trypanosoma brucei gambiense DAL972]CBH11796.1 T. brucei spp.-specific protein [Trypanosoma brucei gambiense DAL972]|eukprot:XP_011774081.1 T. brucei spp.-specific protein [Trypanosoma brucei gambiense DAL972]